MCNGNVFAKSEEVKRWYDQWCKLENIRKCSMCICAICFVHQVSFLLLNSANKQGQRSIGIYIFRLEMKDGKLSEKKSVRFMQLAMCYRQLAPALLIENAYMVSNRFYLFILIFAYFPFRVQYFFIPIFIDSLLNVCLLLNNSCVTNSFLFFLHLPLWVSSYKFTSN